MAINLSIDDLRSAHLHLDSSTEAELAEMPEYFRAEKAALDAAFAEVDSASKARTCVGVQKTNDLALRNDWTRRADATLVRAKFFLRAKAPETVREYFPEPGGIASRKIDRLHAVKKALTVSGHYGHVHLGDFKPKLEALMAEGETIFGAASVSVTGQKTEVERLKETRLRWESQYQKLKFLFRGYFYGTTTDYAKFFGEKRPGRGVQEKAGDGTGTGTGTATATPAPQPVAMAS